MHVCACFIGAQPSVYFGNFIQKDQTFLKDVCDVLELYSVFFKGMKNTKMINELAFYGKFVIRH